MKCKIIKFVSIICILGLAIPLFGTEIKGEALKAKKDKNLEYPIYILDANLLGGLGFTLKYDPAVLEFIDIQNEDLGSNSMIQFNEEESGSVLVSMIDANGMNGNGSLMKLKFKAIGETGAISDIVFSDFRSYDTDLLDVPVTLTNGSVTIMEAGPGFNFKVEYIIMGLLALIILILLFRRRKK